MSFLQLFDFILNTGAGKAQQMCLAWLLLAPLLLLLLLLLLLYKFAATMRQPYYQQPKMLTLNVAYAPH